MGEGDLNMKSQIEDVCRKFRNTIEELRLVGIPHFSSLQLGFPEGTCGDTSLLLGRFFLEQFDVDCFYILGDHYEGQDENFKHSTHAWLEYKDFKIDITADQFENINDRILVVTDHELYVHFQESMRRTISSYFPDELLSTYDLIKGRILS